MSVLMTAYNREAYVGAAIESVLASTLDDFELIVVDDGSSDRTVEIARGYAAQDRRVKVHVNAANLGDYPNRNRAASLARGKYLKYLDSDDLIYPHGLAVMVACMERFPAGGFGLSARAETSRPHPVMLSPREVYCEHFLGKRELLGRAPGSSILRRKSFEAVGGFSGLRQLGDYEFWLKFGAAWPLVTMPAELVWDRSHPAQEQHAHSWIEKEVMRIRVTRSALLSEGCPLNEHERELALRRLDRNQAVVFWRTLVRYCALPEAFEFARAMKVSPASLIRGLAPIR